MPLLVIKTKKNSTKYSKFIPTLKITGIFWAPVVATTALAGKLAIYIMLRQLQFQYE